MYRADIWKGNLYGPIPYNYTCIGYMCYDPSMQDQFEVVYFRESDNLMILYGCIEMTEMVSAMLENSMPIIIAMVKSFLQVDLPEFIMQIFVDSVMRALLNNLKIAHLQWMEVLSPNRRLTSEQLQTVKNFANTFPATNIGNSGTWLDFLYPMVWIMKGLNYEYVQLQQVIQDDTICFPPSA
jgi:hypothetical protein